MAQRKRNLQRRLDHAGRSIAYRIRRVPGLRGMRIRVGATGVEVLLSKRGTVRDGVAFLHEKADWVAEQLEVAATQHAQRIAATSPPPGRMLFRGELVELRILQSPMIRRGTVRSEPARLTVLVAEGEDADVVLERWLRRTAKRAIEQEVNKLSPRIAKPVTQIFVREQRTRWGSCSSRGNLSFNWRLILCPPVVLRYLVVHEMAHLEVPNHSEQFWQRVGQLCADYRVHEAWLRRHEERVLLPTLSSIVEAAFP